MATTASLMILQSFWFGLPPSSLRSKIQHSPKHPTSSSLCSLLHSRASLNKYRQSQHLPIASSAGNLFHSPSNKCVQILQPPTRIKILELPFGSNILTAGYKLRDIAGGPSELVEDAKFVPLNAEDPIYGPPALLLLGFGADETDKIMEFLKKLDGEFLKVIHCTEDMLTRSVWDAMHTEEPSLEAVEIAKSLPRICFLSGLSGEETMMFIDAFSETGLKPAVFAALVPNSANKLLGDVIEEIMGDHEMMTAKSP